MRWLISSQEVVMSVKRKAALAAVVIVGWIALSLALLFIVADDETVVPCPTEDSCVVDYQDGAYHIEQVTP